MCMDLSFVGPLGEAQSDTHTPCDMIYIKCMKWMCITFKWAVTFYLPGLLAPYEALLLFNINVCSYSTSIIWINDMNMYDVRTFMLGRVFAQKSMRSRHYCLYLMQQISSAQFSAHTNWWCVVSHTA